MAKKVDQDPPKPAKVLYLGALEAFVNAASELSRAWDALRTDEDQLTAEREYPFEKSFDEVLSDLIDWRDYVKAYVEEPMRPMRCVQCGTQGEHVKVQREVSNYPDLVCCEMLLDRNLEENACPEVYSCPKCGTPHTRTDFEDEGEGDEAGRTFHYCSQRCLETH
jgi:hypothetical protein